MRTLERSNGWGWALKRKERSEKVAIAWEDWLRGGGM
jgi:hypothetical protein